MQFLVFCTAVLRAVNKWQGLLRASIASAGNDHRLGANEAPPAILSIFLGDMLTDIFEQIEKGGAKSTKQRRRCSTPASWCCRSCRATRAIATAPARSRSPATSSSSARCRRTRASRYPNIALNVAVTESLDYMATELEKATKGGKTLEKAVAELLPKVIKENKRIIFNGNNYSKEWEKEAGKRGLLNLKNTVDALPQLVTKEVVALFEKYKVLNERELHARYEIMVETYNKTVNVEGQLMVLMANRYILPAAFEYQKQVAQSVAAVKAAGGKSVEGKKLLDALTKLTDEFKRRTDKLAKALEHEGNGSAEKHAKHFRDVVIPAMAALRETGDELELDDPARAVAAGDLSRDAVHQVTQARTCMEIKRGGSQPSGKGPAELFHRHRADRSVVRSGRSRTRGRRQRHLRTRRTDGVAHAPIGPDADRDGRSAAALNDGAARSRRSGRAT